MTRAWRLRPIFFFNQSRRHTSASCAAAARALGRARRLRALWRARGLGGALGLELRAAALAFGGLRDGDLGLVRAHVRGERGVGRVDVRLEGWVGGDVGDSRAA
jgi:hypothetical protein